MSLNGAKVVVIGGSSGMGLAVAKMAADEGARVVIAGRSEEKLRQAADEIRQPVEARSLDVTQEQAVQAFFAETGELDHLVVTAATGVAGSFLELETPSFRQIFDSKFWGQYFAARYGAQRIREGGSITFFSGVAATKPVDGLSAYAAVNGAVEALCRSLAVELAPLRVNAVSPGIVDTPAYAGMSPAERKRMFDALAARLPARRIGRPEDAAAAVISLMKNGYVTGSVVHVDGGQRLV
ncbi:MULTISPECIES: SDR family oxidoreductase [Geobacter]|uniref:Short-chain dehydrogenase n=2 Tax=Geobacter TaxID=28231 RepID=A0A0C1TUL4_9BACT|nr:MULTISPECIES: SDR family oxidoreductase [Geobacter]ANA40988.1 short-chain dehydrogenase [Geobacter anodireducens]KIE43093.1 short-chain dehydrogenase [Geobacter soli]MBE2886867.1 SDR family oxidoreductase [Geobacter anodireducens]HMN02216.1 SDR family oxidoreductase [Geobacter anodireducens]